MSEIVTAGILVIGDEILSGRTKDKNIGFIAEYLTNIGIDLKEVRVVADDEADIRWLKHKMDAGAHSAITQFFFEPETFLRFRDRAAAAGIAAPILPGILPIENWKGVRKFAEGCGTLVPDAIAAAFEAAEAEGTTEALAHRHCVALCQRLLDEGVEDLHFYTLNKPHLTEAVCRDLGIVPDAGLVRVA